MMEMEILTFQTLSQIGLRIVQKRLTNALSFSVPLVIYL